MARLVALGDAHLGRTHLAHLRDEQGRNLREEDFLRSFAWAVERTLELEPDGFLWLGDVFDHARPTYRTFSKVLIGLKRLREAGLPGVAISGNHDTPRVRGTGSPYAALEEVFDDVAAIAAGCRFRDCTHEDEPGCAVREAVEEGRLDPDRLESLRKLEAEARAAAARRGGAEAQEEKRRWRTVSRDRRRINRGRGQE